MTTEKQAGANRLNAQKSTGPRTAEGKRRSSMNALKSGIDAKTEVLFTEDPAQLEALAAEYYEHACPATPAERVQIDNQIRSEWRLRRMARIEAQVFLNSKGYTDRNHPASPLGETFTNRDQVMMRLQRMRTNTERSYNNAQRELERLQALRLAEDAAAAAAEAEDAQPQAEENEVSSPKMASFFTPPVEPLPVAFETVQNPPSGPVPAEPDAPPRCA